MKANESRRVGLDAKRQIDSFQRSGNEMAPLVLALQPALNSPGSHLWRELSPASVSCAPWEEQTGYCAIVAIHKCKELKKAPRLLLQGLLMIVAALCAVEAHAEDAGEAVRTSQSFGKAGSIKYIRNHLSNDGKVGCG